MDPLPTLIQKSGAVATITLNRPDKANALSPAMRASLQERLADVAADDAIEVVLIRAEGRTLHLGRRSGTAEGKILDANGTLLAHGTTTCLVFAL